MSPSRELTSKFTVFFFILIVVNMTSDYLAEQFYLLTSKSNSKSEEERI